MTIRRLNTNDQMDLKQLTFDIEMSLSNDKFWLPISDVSREHFFDLNWTIFWGAYDGERLIGAAGLFLNENEYGESQKYIRCENEKVAEIGRLMCHPDYRGQGVAAHLVNEVLKTASRMDLDILLATVHPQNKPSQKVLMEAGFVKEGHIVKSKNYERDILIRRMR